MLGQAFLTKITLRYPTVVLDSLPTVGSVTESCSVGNHAGRTGVDMDLVPEAAAGEIGHPDLADVGSLTITMS